MLRRWRVVWSLVVVKGLKRAGRGGLRVRREGESGEEMSLVSIWTSFLSVSVRYVGVLV